MGERGGDSGGSLMMYARDLRSLSFFRFSLGFLSNANFCVFPETIPFCEFLQNLDFTICLVLSLTLRKNAGWMRL